MKDLQNRNDGLALNAKILHLLYHKNYTLSIPDCRINAANGKKTRFHVETLQINKIVI